jgi:hypothetical protein
MAALCVRQRVWCKHVTVYRRIMSPIRGGLSSQWNLDGADGVPVVVCELDRESCDGFRDAGFVAAVHAPLGVAAASAAAHGAVFGVEVVTQADVQPAEGRPELKASGELT